VQIKFALFSIIFLQFMSEFFAPKILQNRLKNWIITNGLCVTTAFIDLAIVGWFGSVRRALMRTVPNYIIGVEHR
jgi:hypothetical protein